MQGRSAAPPTAFHPEHGSDWVSVQWLCQGDFFIHRSTQVREGSNSQQVLQCLPLSKRMICSYRLVCVCVCVCVLPCKYLLGYT